MARVFSYVFLDIVRVDKTNFIKCLTVASDSLIYIVSGVTLNTKQKVGTLKWDSGIT